jgi:hypothetical protein
LSLSQDWNKHKSKKNETVFHLDRKLFKQIWQA